MTAEFRANAYAYALLSVSDMTSALDLWANRFGMQITARLQGSDPAWAKRLGMAAEDIVDQALLVTPGRIQGGIHLVQFRTPASCRVTGSRVPFSFADWALRN